MSLPVPYSSHGIKILFTIAPFNTLGPAGWLYFLIMTNDSGNNLWSTYYVPGIFQNDSLHGIIFPTQVEGPFTPHKL
jgi:hypothetical protein